MRQRNRTGPLIHAKDEEIRSIVDRISGIVRRHLPAERYRILLCGSWATGQAAPTSDIDLAIHGSDPVDERILAQIREEIDRLPTLRKVDLIDLATVGASFRNKVLQQAEIVA